MKKFMDKDLLLSTETAKELYHGIAAELPIIDYHCHVSPREIYEDKQFCDLTELWLGGDHYKWRLMRSCGVDEYYITGSAAPKEKFDKFAYALSRAIGNPMYHWCHLELKKYFGYEGVLSPATADEVWALAEKKLAEGNMSVRSLIKNSNVAFIGTTDDPADTLEWHEKLAADDSFTTVVGPSFRPDKALDIEKDGWCEYIAKLADAAEMKISSFEDIKTALSNRLDKFCSLGCRASDHGLSKMAFATATSDELEAITAKCLGGEKATAEEAEKFKTALLLFCAAEYKTRGMAMQIHYNCTRNPNTVMFNKLGPDSGFDCIGTDCNGREKLVRLLDAIKCNSGLPKTILYSLDATDNAFLGSLIGSFQDGEAGKIQHGSAWWFNDHIIGMREQLKTLASLSALGNFVGMLTDSRSFLSYTRHEYFRRILCGIIGEWVEDGEFPNDKQALSTLVSDICYYNAKRYFDL